MGRLLLMGAMLALLPVCICCTEQATQAAPLPAASEIFPEPQWQRPADSSVLLEREELLAQVSCTPVTPADRARFEALRIAGSEGEEQAVDYCRGIGLQLVQGGLLGNNFAELALLYGHRQLLEWALDNSHGSNAIPQLQLDDLLLKAVRLGDVEAIATLGRHGAQISTDLSWALTREPDDTELLTRQLGFILSQAQLSTDPDEWGRTLEELLPYITLEDLQAILRQGTHYSYTDEYLQQYELISRCGTDPRKLQALIDSGYDPAAAARRSGFALFALVANCCSYMEEGDPQTGLPVDPAGLLQVLIDNGYSLQQEIDRINSGEISLGDSDLRYLVLDAAGYPAAIRMLAEAGLDLSQPTGSSHTPLHMLALTDRLPDETIVQLVELGMDPLAVNRHGMRPLHYFLLKGRVELARRLFELSDRNAPELAAVFGSMQEFDALTAGLAPEEVNRLLEEAMLYAGLAGDMDRISTLAGRRGSVAIQALVAAGDRDALAQALQSGEFCILDGIAGFWPLKLALDVATPEVLDMLLGNERIVSGLDDSQRQYLVADCARDQLVDKLALLLEHGFPVDPQEYAEDSGGSPLCAAIRRSDPVMLRMPLAAGADPNVGLRFDEASGAWLGTPPLYYCLQLDEHSAQTGHPSGEKLEMLNILLDAGARVDFLSSHGLLGFGNDSYQPLLDASGLYFDPQQLRLLLEHGADPSQHPLDPSAPDEPPAASASPSWVVMFKYRDFDRALLEELLEAASDSQIDYALEFAVSNGRDDLLPVMLERMQQLPEVNRQMKLVRDACVRGQRDCVDQLTGRGLATPGYSACIAELLRMQWLRIAFDVE